MPTPTLAPEPTSSLAFSTFKPLAANAGSPAWLQTNAELLALKHTFCDVHDTPSKDHTAEQKETLKALRAQAVAIGHKRGALLKAGQA
jgi:hypothetical protein